MDEFGLRVANRCTEMIQDFLFLAPQIKEPLYDFSDGSLPARDPGCVEAKVFDFRTCVLNGDREPHSSDYRQVEQVVTNVCNFFFLKLVADQKLI